MPLINNALTHLILTEIEARDTKITGKIVTRPALLVTDGINTTYAVDVDIGNETILRNVPIATGNRDLIYAEAGAACTLTRSDSGRYEVTGFSKEMPGTYIKVAVNLDNFTMGPVVDTTTNSRPLTFEELSTFGSFGSTPFGAVAVYSGTTLLRIV